MEQLIRLLTDPVSNRIIQIIRTGGRMTVAQILARTPDLPRATVYRRVEKLLKAEVIEIAGTNRVRGQTENIYAIRRMFIRSPKEPADGMKLVTAALMRIFGLFRGYFVRQDADPERDKLFLTNYAVSLSDRDFAAMMQEIYAAADKYQQKPAGADARLRNLYVMSVPTGGEEHEQET